MAGAFSGFLAYGIGFMNGTQGLKGWSWIIVCLNQDNSCHDNRGQPTDSGRSHDRWGIYHRRPPHSLHQRSVPT